MVKILQPLLLTYTNHQTMQHIEYPDLTQLPDRIRRSRRARIQVGTVRVDGLLYIANNLHNPPPPSPATKKEAAAALEWLQERAINDAHKAQLAKVTSYLASLPTSPNPP